MPQEEIDANGTDSVGEVTPSENTDVSCLTAPEATIAAAEIQRLTAARASTSSLAQQRFNFFVILVAATIAGLGTAAGKSNISPQQTSTRYRSVQFFSSCTAM